MLAQAEPALQALLARVPALARVLASVAHRVRALADHAPAPEALHRLRVKHRVRSAPLRRAAAVVSSIPRRRKAP